MSSFVQAMHFAAAMDLIDASVEELFEMGDINARNAVCPLGTMTYTMPAYCCTRLDTRR